MTFYIWGSLVKSLVHMRFFSELFRLSPDEMICFVIFVLLVTCMFFACFFLSFYRYRNFFRSLIFNCFTKCPIMHCFISKHVMMCYSEGLKNEFLFLFWPFWFLKLLRRSIVHGDSGLFGIIWRLTESNCFLRLFDSFQENLQIFQA